MRNLHAVWIFWGYRSPNRIFWPRHWCRSIKPGYQTYQQTGFKMCSRLYRVITNGKWQSEDEITYNKLPTKWTNKATRRQTDTQTHAVPVQRRVIYSSPKPSAFCSAIISFCLSTLRLPYDGKTSWLKHVCDIGNLHGTTIKHTQLEGTRQSA